MSDYTKATNFATKDSLPAGSALKIVRGTEIDTEFNAIATAVATKANSSDVTTSLATKTDNSAAAITGGTVNGAVIGGTTPAAGTFTTLTSTGNTVLGDASTDTLNVGNGGLIKDASGNVGVNVTPNAWGSGWKAIQIGQGANFVGRTNVVNQLQLIANGYFNGTNYIYENTGEATQYYQTGGTHVWSYAASGTAGNAITFTQAMTLDTSGNFLVGTTSADIIGANGDGVTYRPASKSLSVNATSSAPVNIGRSTSSGTLVNFFYNAAVKGTISTDGSTTAYNTSSDYRLKEDVQPMTGALAKVAALKPCTYKWKADGADGEGFIAHELAEVVPQCVTGQKDAVETYTDEEGNEQTRPVYQGIDTSFLIATLTAAIQELNALSVEQQTLINQLTARITALEAK